MKTLFPLLLTLVFAITAVGQVPDPENSNVDPQVAAAKALAQQFIEKAFTKDYSDAEEMMNPEPPNKGGTSASEFKKQRVEGIKKIVETRNEMGTERVWDKISSGKFKAWSDRPAGEEFADFVFSASYPDGKRSYNRVTVIKKNGSMYIERFMY